GRGILTLYTLDTCKTPLSRGCQTFTTQTTASLKDTAAKVRSTSVKPSRGEASVPEARVLDLGRWCPRPIVTLAGVARTVSASRDRTPVRWWEGCPTLELTPSGR